MPTRAVRKRIARKLRTYSPALEYSWTRLPQRYRSRTPQTRRDRVKHLRVIARTLKDGGYTIRPDQLQRTHVIYVIDAWHRRGLSDRTIASRLSTLRWLANILGRAWLLPAADAAHARARTRPKDP